MDKTITISYRPEGSNEPYKEETFRVTNEGSKLQISKGGMHGSRMAIERVSDGRPFWLSKRSSFMGSYVYGKWNSHERFEYIRQQKIFNMA